MTTFRQKINQFANYQRTVRELNQPSPRTLRSEQRPHRRH